MSKMESEQPLALAELMRQAAAGFFPADRLEALIDRMGNAK